MQNRKLTPEEKKAYDKAYNKAYYEANREEIKTRKKAHNKAYYEANREKIKTRKKAYREANKNQSTKRKNNVPDAQTVPNKKRRVVLPEQEQDIYLAPVVEQVPPTTGMNFYQNFFGSDHLFFDQSRAAFLARKVEVSAAEDEKFIIAYTTNLDR